MKKILVIVVCFLICGCSMPTAATKREIYSFTREEKKVRGVFGKKKSVSIKDFRQNDMYEEDMQALKEEVERYIAARPQINEAVKFNLRELKVTAGLNKEEVKLLLGEPDKISSELWIYKISKIRAITVFIVPIFFVHEGYYLYFKDGVLAGIERHYPKQVVEQSPGPGVFQKTGASGSAADSEEEK